MIILVFTKKNISKISSNIIEINYTPIISKPLSFNQTLPYQIKLLVIDDWTDFTSEKSIIEKHIDSVIVFTWEIWNEKKLIGKGISNTKINSNENNNLYYYHSNYDMRFNNYSLDSVKINDPYFSTKSLAIFYLEKGVKYFFKIIILQNNSAKTNADAYLLIELSDELQSNIEAGRYTGKLFIGFASLFLIPLIIISYLIATFLWFKKRKRLIG